VDGRVVDKMAVTVEIAITRAASRGPFDLRELLKPDSAVEIWLP